MPNCITGTAAVFQPSTAQAWNKRRVQHLFNRIGVGASLTDIQWALSLSPEEVVDALIDEAIAMPLPDADNYPMIANPLYGQGNGGDNFRMMYDFFINLVEGQPLISKLVLFWSNHFVTENQLFEQHVGWVFYYLTHLQENALGRFLEMTKSIGLTPVMLRYLNGNRNYRNSPNENYARELLELFTTGPDQYTQNDIEEIARLLTGWRTEGFPYSNSSNSGPVNPYFPFTINAHIFTINLHDWGSKTVFGKTFTPDEETKDEAFQEYLWLHHEVIFKERKDEVARFICGKLYRFFVYDEINEDFVETLAETFKSNDWQLAPVLRQLLKSEHFFDEKAIGGNIKSPIEYMLSFLRQANLAYEEDYIDFGSYFQYSLHRVWLDTTDLGQEFLRPVNVAGWEGGKTWITENTLVKRWAHVDTKLNYYKNNLPDTQEKFRQLVKDLTEDFSSADDFNNVEVITEAIVRHFMIADVSPDTLAAAVVAFKDTVPENYFEDGTWNLEWAEVPRQFLSLMQFLIRLPEYQLN